MTGGVGGGRRGQQISDCDRAGWGGLISGVYVYLCSGGGRGDGGEYESKSEWRKKLKGVRVEGEFLVNSQVAVASFCFGMLNWGWCGGTLRGGIYAV